MAGAVSHGFGPTILALEDLLEAGSVTGQNGRRLLADLLAAAAVLLPAACLLPPPSAPPVSS